MNESRTFPLADVLTVTTGRLLSRDHMNGLYRILNFLTSDDLMTHQLSRAANACRLPILQQHPQLVDVEPATNAELSELEAWLAEQERIFGQALAISPIDGWEHRNPIEELVSLVGAERVIPVIVADGGKDHG